MTRKKHFKNVESVLAKFPKEAQVNYYRNKKTLIIDDVTCLANSLAEYSPKYNRIKLVDKKVLEHELFHMAFNDRENLGKEIKPNIYLNNGVSYVEGKNNKECGIGLTEGFAESLARKSKTETFGREFQCCIVNILISIYGEELYFFPLKNDPVGFYNYCSQSIYSIRDCLDLYTEVSSHVGEIIKKFNSNGIDDFEVANLITCCKKIIPAAILGSIKNVISEYNNCSSPKVTKLELKKQIEEILSTEEILLEIILCDRVGVDLKQEINNIIDSELMAKQYTK